MRDPITNEWAPSPTLVNHDDKTINTWWMAYPDPGNFGDILTPWLIKTISGYTGQYIVNDPFAVPVLLGSGSIIEFANRNCVVWGSGLIKATTHPNPYAKYLSVRGPLTYEIIRSNNIYCPKIFGDPAMLLPSLYNKDLPKKYEIGIIPHYVDYDLVNEWYKDHPEVHVINPLNSDITFVIDEIIQCEKIISSSLHGIIVANAYGIPATWVKFSNKLYGDDTKFHDHFGAMNVKQSFTEFFEKIPINDLTKFNYFRTEPFDGAELLSLFPDFNHPSS